MSASNFPSVNRIHRRADLAVHLVGLMLILGAGSVLIAQAGVRLGGTLVFATALYALCALLSNLASIVYHFSPWHAHRTLLRRIDHAAIYPSITGTFTPFFILADTVWTWSLLVLCWAITLGAMWLKVTSETVKSRWSTASYLGLGALGLCALPDLTTVPIATLWCIVSGAVLYVIGTVFYARRSMPYRYAIWHMFVNFGGIAMFVGLWLSLF
jgi:hemolysin III